MGSKYVVVWVTVAGGGTPSKIRAAAGSMAPFFRFGNRDRFGGDTPSMPAPTSSDSVEAAEGLETTSYPFEGAGLGNRHFFWIREVLNSPKIRVIFPLNNQHAVAVGRH